VLGRTEGEPARFGAKLRVLRERAGLTQEELAERAGVTPHAISALERGTRTRPYPHTVRSIADALQVSDAERKDLIASVPSRTSATHLIQSPSPEATAGRPGGGVDLVVPPTRLHGRDRDVAQVAHLARSGTARIITLTGPGGVGKTRLAAAVSAELADDYPDGIVQIALAAMADATDVLPSIGKALELTGTDRPGGLNLVAAHLRQRRVLLVLDNFEHLLSAAADVSQLVWYCPTVTVLITSRSLLRIRGEREFKVGPLALPAGEVTSPEELAASASGALVLDRALDASALPMTADDLRALGRLCERLAGIPLAIELATAHLRLLTPQNLLERLDSISSSSGARDLPERQRTMRATLDWSYGLLSARQQALFRMLGVFRGGATLGAVEEVAAASGTFAEAEPRSSSSWRC